MVRRVKRNNTLRKNTLRKNIRRTSKKNTLRKNTLRKNTKINSRRNTKRKNTLRKNTLRKNTLRKNNLRKKLKKQRIHKKYKGGSVLTMTKETQDSFKELANKWEMATDSEGNKYYTNDKLIEFTDYMEAEENGPFRPIYVALYKRVKEHAGRDKDEKLLKEVIECVKIIKREERYKLDQERKAEEADETTRLHNEAKKQAEEEAATAAALEMKKVEDNKKAITNMIKNMRKTHKSAHKATYKLKKKEFETLRDSDITDKVGEAYEKALAVLNALDNDNVPTDEQERHFSPAGTGLKQLISDAHAILIVKQHTEYTDDYNQYIGEQCKKINKGWFYGYSWLRKKVDELIDQVKEYLARPVFANIRTRKVVTTGLGVVKQLQKGV